jgi:hypothetical protein
MMMEGMENMMMITVLMIMSLKGAMMMMRLLIRGNADDHVSTSLCSGDHMMMMSVRLLWSENDMAWRK